MESFACEFEIVALDFSEDLLAISTRGRLLRARLLGRYLYRWRRRIEWLHEPMIDQHNSSTKGGHYEAVCFVDSFAEILFGHLNSGDLSPIRSYRHLGAPPLSHKQE